MARVRVQLQVLGQEIAAEIPRPAPTVRLDAVLPLLRELDDRAIDLAVAKVASEHGERVTCAKGCSACCRAQPVPVTPVEAYALWRLVKALPEPRRTAVRARFDANVAALQAAGLLERFLERPRTVAHEDARQAARAYFALGLVCPFLTDDACGIYADRPFVCRQYLVTSPAEQCANPFDGSVRVVPMPLRFAHAMLETSETLLNAPQVTIPLAVALEYVERHRDELERTFSSESLFRTALERVAAG
jgi:Fe-S-cluster containining protein